MQSLYKLLCLGGHQASLAARPLHGDSAGFNYSQLCLISLPSWALCPSVLCKYATFSEVKVRHKDECTHTQSRCWGSFKSTQRDSPLHRRRETK